MKKTLLYVLPCAFLSVSTLLTSCSGPTSAETEAVVADTAKAKRDSLVTVKYQQELVQRIQKVATNFKLKQDEFSKSGWYTHKVWREGYPNKNGLSCFVNTKGFIYLISHYYGDDWIFQEKSIVKIGDQIMETQTVPSYDDNNQKENSGGSVWETLNYMQSEDILRAISRAGDKPVKVRLEGRQHIKDFTLSKTDQRAIADSYKLARLIQQRDSLSTPQVAL